MALIPVQVVQDDSDWYVIPKVYYSIFLNLIDRIERCESHSDEWYDLIDKFERIFGEYATGGDINLIQLYANI